MSIRGIRFRVEGELCVLQVLEVTPGRNDGFGYRSDEKREWRDAKATDLLDVAAFTNSPEDLERRISYLQECVSRLETTVMSTASLDQRPPRFDQFPG